MPPDEVTSRLIAAVATLIILLLIGKLLLQTPSLPTGLTEQGLRVTYLARLRSVEVRTAPTATAVPGSPTPAQPSLPSRQRPALPQRPPVTTPNPASARQSAPVPAENRLIERLYDRDSGRVRLPPQARIDPMAGNLPPGRPPGLPNERERQRAQDLLYPPNPIHTDPDGPFGGTWASDGTLGQQAARKLSDGLANLGKKIFGEDPQTVRARPPPEVGFKPQAYAQPSDLGRAETGNAYKAAPIAYEKIPAGVGQGSARIRTALADLRKRAQGCDRARTDTLLSTVQMHLKELEQVDYAMGHGADPVMAQQLLPRRADTAYDQARRALWYAENQLNACLK